MDVGANANNKPLTVQFPEVSGTVELEYDPGALTIRLMRDVAQAAQGGPAEQVTFAADFIAALVTRWDVTKDGQPVPIQKESLLDLPIWLLGRVAEMIREDISPNSPPPASEP